MVLKDLRSFLLNGFLVLLAVTVFDYVYGQMNTFPYPGLGQRIVWATAIVGLLSFALYLPNMELRPLNFSVRSFLQKLRTGGLGIRRLKIAYEPPSEEAMRRNISIVFQTLLAVFLFSLLAELVLPTPLPFDLNFLLVSMIVFGILFVAFKQEESEVREQLLTKKDYFLAGAGVAGARIVEPLKAVSERLFRGETLSSVLRYFRGNLGAPFVVGFQVLLLVCAGLLVRGLSGLANEVAVYAYYLLVIGVFLQLVSFLKHRNGTGE